MTDVMPGPCCICGGINYSLSMGGPTICPKCDCGHFDAATVMQQAKVIELLRAEVELWKDRCEATLADAQRMERSFDEAWNRDER